MRPRAQSMVLILVVLSCVALLAASWKGGAADPRVEQIESSLARLSGVTSKVSQQVVELESVDKASTKELGSLKAALSDLTESIGALEAELAAVKSRTEGSSSLATKVNSLSNRVDSLSSKLSAVDKRLWVLEQKYNDHLRKYHSG